MSTTNRITPDDRAPRPNGHAPSHANGRADEGSPTNALSSTVRPAKNTPQISSSRSRARAAADDPHAVPNATAAAPPPARTASDASAAAARDSKIDPTNGESPISDLPASAVKPDPKSEGPSAAKNSKREPPPPLPPGERPLPPDGGRFVDSVHEKADITEAGRRLLNSEDEKIVKGIWDLLVSLKYRNAEDPFGKEPPEVKVGIPRPIRDKPLQPPPQS